MSSLTLSHLSTYPILVDGSSYIPPSLSSLAKKVYHSLPPPPAFAQGYIKQADALADSSLSKVDERFPALKKPTPQLAEKPKQIVLSTVGTYEKAFRENVYSPNQKRVDPLLTKALDVTESVLDFFLPKKYDETTLKKDVKGPSDQLERVHLLSQSAINRIVPTAKHSLNLPSDYAHSTLDAINALKERAQKSYNKQPKDDFLPVRLLKASLSLFNSFYEEARNSDTVKDGEKKLNGVAESTGAQIDETAGKLENRAKKAKKEIQK